jgi:hypothetical protein
LYTRITTKPGIAELAVLESIHSITIVEETIVSPENQEIVRQFYPGNEGKGNYEQKLRFLADLVLCLHSIHVPQWN